MDSFWGIVPASIRVKQERCPDIVQGALMLFPFLSSVAFAAPQEYRFDIVRYSIAADADDDLPEAKVVSLGIDISCARDAEALVCTNPSGVIYSGVSRVGEVAGELSPMLMAFTLTGPLNEQGDLTDDWGISFSGPPGVPSSDPMKMAFMVFEANISLQNFLGALIPVTLPGDCQVAMKSKDRSGTILNHVIYRSNLSSIRLKHTVESCGETIVVSGEGRSAQAPRSAQSMASELVSIYQISDEVHQRSDGVVIFRRYEHFAARGGLLGSFSLQLEAL